MMSAYCTRLKDPQNKYIIIIICSIDFRRCGRVRTQAAAYSN